MKRILQIIACFCLLFGTFTKSVLAMTFVAQTSAVIKNDIDKDIRQEKLEQFLKSYDSPLAAYAGVFIQKADEYNIPDWKLVPAVTGVESTFGKAIPFNSYNAYGWNNGNYSFSSWEESIDVVTRTLKFKYIDRGLDTVEKIACVYAPPSNTWAGKVNYFMHEIEVFLPRKSSQLSVSI